MPNNPNSQQPRGKMPKMNFGFTWFYFLLILGIGFMLFGQRGSNPQKIEWAEVETMIEAGDVKEIHFVRNDYQGKVTIRPERLSKYADKFGGQVPSRSPHFTFMTSNKFDPELVQDHHGEQQQGLGGYPGDPVVPADPRHHVDHHVPRHGP